MHKPDPSISFSNLLLSLSLALQSLPTMDSLLYFFVFFSLSCIVTSSCTDTQSSKPYIVYMGSSSKVHEADAEQAHLEILSSIIPSEESERISIIHSYNHALKGFSAMLTEKEATSLLDQKDIISVFPDPYFQLHTTRSWDFLNTQSGIQSRTPYHHPLSSDVIVGMIDTGIWPESPSFSDEGLGEIPSKWKGVCMEGPDFKKINCNRKLIGARYYNNIQFNWNHTQLAKSGGSPRDLVGHGTHTASIAAGAKVANASYYGLGFGAARGGSSTSRIAVYKACNELGCSGSSILKAFDDAIRDGVDIVSISIGMSSVFQPDFLNDPIAIGAFHAEQMGVIVVCSGGNEGPDSYTVVNTAPWIFTVAASNIDRAFQSTVILGNGKSFQGSAINFSNLTKSEVYPLVFGGDVASKYTPISEARNCYPGSLDRQKIAGRIVICLDSDPTVSREVKKLVVEDAKAKGIILIDEVDMGSPYDSGVYPFAQLGKSAGLQLLEYINSTRRPTATILPTVEIPRYKPAPAVAYFSSRGPGSLTENILKPDAMAPGVAILAAIAPKTLAGNVPTGKKLSNFSIKSGTSMACPHVTGAAAFVKSVHPHWSSSMIKSALMTTATISNNMRKPITDNSSTFATPHETGAGEISPLRALHPGIVFETKIEDHLRFLCFYGYKQKYIRSMSNTMFICPRNSVEDLVSNINYPSISISNLGKNNVGKEVTRTITNVGPLNSTYVVAVHAPAGLQVKVSPSKISFSHVLRKASFKVWFNGKTAAEDYNYGSLTWSDGLHAARVVFAVNVV